MIGMATYAIGISQTLVKRRELSRSCNRHSRNRLQPNTCDGMASRAACLNRALKGSVTREAIVGKGLMGTDQWTRGQHWIWVYKDQYYNT